jgi:hypothetical protein
MEQRSKSRLFGLKMLLENSNGMRITLPTRGITFDGFAMPVDGEDGSIVIVPRYSGLTATLSSRHITQAVFHLFNFPKFFGPDDFVLTTGEPPLQGRQRCDRVLLAADGWKVVIAGTQQTDKLTKALRTNGGFVITHVGQIVRDDGSNFTSDQLAEMLHCIQHFLSFALGRWAGVALTVGFDAIGNRAFEEWGLRKTADGPWNGGLSWFDSDHAELLSEVFPGFFALWRSDLWHEPLAHALYWYIAACDRRIGVGVDAGLILAQSALESLAWTYCVMDRKMVSPRAFKPRGLSAADKFRLLATSLEIPTEIPLTLPVLSSSVKPKWDDSMAAITEIRNALVHAITDVKIPDGTYSEAWKLSLWYIELILLRLCQHSGSYANRLAQRWAGTVVSVPWATTGPKQLDTVSNDG